MKLVQPKSDESKSLVYVAKILQNMANQTKVLEEDLKVFNKLIEEKNEEMINFLKNLSNYDRKNYVQKKKFPVHFSSLVLELDSLDQLVVDLFAKMEKKVEEEKFLDCKDEFLSLKNILEIIDEKPNLDHS